MILLQPCSIENEDIFASFNESSCSRTMCSREVSEFSMSICQHYLVVFVVTSNSQARAEDYLVGME